MAKRKKFPEVVYMNAQGADTSDGPFTTCTADKEAIVDDCMHNEEVAVYKLIEIRRAAKRFDLVKP